jgi:hypothetical protein
LTLFGRSKHKAGKGRSGYLFFLPVGFEPDIDLLAHIIPNDIIGPVVILFAFHDTQENISWLAVILKHPDYIENLLVFPYVLLDLESRFVPLALIETFAMRDP